MKSLEHVTVREIKKKKKQFSLLQLSNVWKISLNLTDLGSGKVSTISRVFENLSYYRSITIYVILMVLSHVTIDLGQSIRNSTNYALRQKAHKL